MLNHGDKVYRITISSPLDLGNGTIVNGLYNLCIDVKFEINEILQTIDSFFDSSGCDYSLNFIKDLEIYFRKSKYSNHFLIEFFKFGGRFEIEQEC